MSGTDRNIIQNTLSEFRKQYGRKPRVLHIGNIAANAYNNSKLLNEIGFDCFVLCPDYYHIMGCPEWEDAIIDGEIRNQFRPDWTEVNLNDFVRPKWFVQGPMLLCIHYIKSCLENKHQRSDYLWRMLKIVNKTGKAKDLDERLHYCYWIIFSLKEKFLRHLVNPTILIDFLNKKYSSNRIRIPRILVLIMGALVKCARRIFNYVFYIICCLTGKYNTYKTTTERINADHKSLYGNTNTDITIMTMVWTYNTVSQLESLFKNFDIIQGYSTDPVYPYLSGYRYFSFEHGTLRTIPFDGTVLGSLTGMAYSHSERIFVTNTDCIDNAKRLNPVRITVIPHPFDERRMEQVGNWMNDRNELMKELDAEFIIFYPTRHDWIEGKGYADKANDVFIRAYAQLVKKHRLGLICCQWGHNVEESNDLFGQLDCLNSVKWMQPMCVRTYETMMKASHVIVDQFLLGAFGGVTFRGLAAARPVCTYLNCDEIKSAYGECPPIINCKTEEEIFTKLDQLFHSEEERKRYGRKSLEWIHEYHSGIKTAQDQAYHYAIYLKEKAAQ